MEPGLTPDGTSLSLDSNNESPCPGTTLSCGEFFLAPSRNLRPCVSLLYPCPPPTAPSYYPEFSLSQEEV